MERSCDGCPLRAGCVKVCPEIEAALPKAKDGRGGFSRHDMDEERWQEILLMRGITDALRSYADLLEATQRAAFDLYYCEGIGHQEIADRLGITRQAVSQRLVSARARILRHIEAESSS